MVAERQFRHLNWPHSNMGLLAGANIVPVFAGVNNITYITCK